MRVLAGYILWLVGVLIMALAFVVWITSPYPDISPFRVFGIFESGFGGILLTQVLWFRVVIVAFPGLLLYQAGRHLIGRKGK